MKNKVLGSFVWLFVTILLTGCKTNGNNPDVPANVMAAFTQKYPSSSNIDWDNDGSYMSVDFMNKGLEHEAWFSNDGVWMATNIDMPFTMFPAAVRDGFMLSNYASWGIDDTEMWENANSPASYLIEVENGNNEITLFFNEMGEIVKESNGNVNNNPAALPSQIKDIIHTMYPNSVAIHVDYSDAGSVEVSIIDDNIVKEVLFSAQNKWVNTSWDVPILRVPTVVINVLKGTAYRGYEIDDIEYRQTPHNKVGFYHVELEKKGSMDLFVNISPEGEIILD